MNATANVPLPPFRPRLVAMDMDGTLLSAKHEITPRLKTALQGMENAGIMGAVATGRHVEDLRPWLEHLPLSGPTILCNGAVLVDPRDRSLRYTARMNREMAVAVIKKATQLKSVCFVCCDDGAVYMEHPGDTYGKDFADEIKIFQFARPEALKVVANASGPNPYKISSLGRNRDLRELAGYAGGLSDALGFGPADGLKPAFSMEKLVDIQPLSCSKASGLKRVCAALGISAWDVVTIGDGMNDEEMIRFAGFGLAMGHAPAELKAAAKGVLPSNTEDGVAQFLEALIARETAARS